MLYEHIYNARDKCLYIGSSGPAAAAHFKMCEQVSFTTPARTRARASATIKQTYNTTTLSMCRCVGFTIFGRECAAIKVPHGVLGVLGV